MAEYRLKEESVPLDDSWDVIVAGGGPAGCTAAAAAAREGARTLLIEATGSLGGMGTSGLVPAWCPFTDKERIIYGGMAEFVLKETMKVMAHVPEDRFDWTPIDPERLKQVYDDLVAGHGATVLFNTMLAGVETDGKGHVDTVVVANKAGLAAYRAKVYVDCTGDADLAVWAGAEYEKGDETGSLQPATHCFIFSNVNEKEYARIRLHPANPESPIYRIQKEGKYPLIPDLHLCNNLIGPGTVGFNAGHLHQVDNTDPASVSRALIQGRKIAAAFRDALQEYVPGAFGNAFLAATGSLMGIRETRRIMGDYVLTRDDYVARRSFEDEICRNCYFIDIHFDKKVFDRLNQAGADVFMKEVEKRSLHYEPGESHGIPYRCLTPRKLKNVLVAGRSISTDRVVQGSTRVMPVCLCMGEAAGLGAAMARGNSGDVRGVDVQELRGKLRGYGGWLPKES